jgi:hypothetical protein
MNIEVSIVRYVLRIARFGMSQRKNGIYRTCIGSKVNCGNHNNTNERYVYRIGS